MRLEAGVVLGVLGLLLSGCGSESDAGSGSGGSGPGGAHSTGGSSTGGGGSSGGVGGGSVGGSSGSGASSGAGGTAGSGGSKPWGLAPGIPMPPFGINEQAGPSSYYVDNQSPNATDSSNPSGTPEKPRATIPESLPAGAVVEVHGGPYVYDISGIVAIHAGGTETQPVFVKGVGNPLFIAPKSAGAERTLLVDGSYYIIEGIIVGDSVLNIVLTGDHGVLRNSEVRNYDPPGFGDAVGVSGSNFLIWKNHIHHSGNALSPTEDDVHGFKCTTGCDNVWILDNHFHENGGQDVQIGDDLTQEPWPNHIYVGRNLGHDSREGCLYSKQARNVIFSQNECYGNHTPADASATGTGIAVARFGADQNWAIFNKVHDCSVGIRANGNEDVAQSRAYIVGNVVYDIHGAADSADPYSEGAAIMGWNNGDVFVVDNTIVDVDKCISFTSTGTHTLHGNLCAKSGAPMTYVSGSPGGGTQDYGFFDPAAKAAWGSVTPIVELGTLSSSGACANCLEGNALLDAALHLQPGSPALDKNVKHAVYDTFQSWYGLDIATDADGKARPASGWDIGAFEQ